MRALTSVPGGVAYVRDGNLPLTKAVFVVGDTEVNLSLCNCVSAEDVVGETEAWAERVGPFGQVAVVLSAALLALLKKQNPYAIHIRVLF